MLINKELLLEDINKKLSIYEISNKYNVDHKIIRAYFIKYNIKTEFNLLLHKQSYIIPQKKELFNKNSIEAHISYLCEGWHTDKTRELCLYNQDEFIVKDFCLCIFNIYNYNKKINLEFVFNQNCLNSTQIAARYKIFFDDKNKYNIRLVNDKQRKNPIIRVKCGGKNLAKLFIENAYEILNEINS